MPFPDALESTPERKAVEILNTERSLRLITRLAIENFSEKDDDKLDAQLDETLANDNAYLPMPLDELNGRLRRFVQENRPDFSTRDTVITKRTLTEAQLLALALTCRNGTSEAMHRGKFRYPKIEIPEDYPVGAYPGYLRPLHYLAGQVDFAPYSEPDERLPKPTQAIVLHNKVVGTVVRSIKIPGAEKVWRALVDTGESHEDGSPALRQIMYGYDLDPRGYAGLPERSLVVVALPDADLLRPDGTHRKLRRRHWNIRDDKGNIIERVDSDGMLCSWHEACDKPRRRFVKAAGWRQEIVLTLPPSNIPAGTRILTIEETSGNASGHSALRMIIDNNGQQERHLIA